MPQVKSPPNKIKEFRVRKNYTYQQVADMVDAAAPTINKLEKGYMALTHEWADKLCAIFDCTPNDLMGHEEKSKIPILGVVPAGQWLDAIEDPDAPTIYFHTGGKAGFIALQVKGDSMNLLAPEGSYVVVDTNSINPSLLDGRPIVVMNDGEVTLKILNLPLRALEPRSTNPVWRAQPIGMDWRVLGEAVAFITIARNTGMVRGTEVPRNRLPGKQGSGFEPLIVPHPEHLTLQESAPGLKP